MWNTLPLHGKQLCWLYNMTSPGFLKKQVNTLINWLFVIQVVDTFYPAIEDGLVDPEAP